MIKHVHIGPTKFDGVSEITAAGWDGRILRMSRTTYFEWRNKHPDALSTCIVYVLFADHFEKLRREDRLLYVGHTEDVAQRGASHERSKEFWTAALIFTSAGDWMNSAHTKRIENVFIQWAREASRYDVENGNAGGQGRLGPADELIVKAFLAPVREVLRFANLDVFENNPAGVYGLVREEVPGRRGLTASAKILSGIPRVVEVLAGSELWISFPDRQQLLIDSLVAAGHARFDADAKIISFLQSSQVPLEPVMGSILGNYPAKWLNSNRQNMADAFDRLAVESPSTPLPTSSIDSAPEESQDGDARDAV
jgi:hypothetical protein